MNKYEFEILSYLETKKEIKYSLRSISEALMISESLLLKELELLSKEELIIIENQKIMISKTGLASLEPYRVKRAIILGAGFGSRLMPATKNRPKPMVKVKGKRIIETLLDALIEKGIEDITIVRGYKKESFDELLEKYPMIKFIDNENYDTENNISSIMLSLHLLDCPCYICEADLYISNANIIKKYQYESNFLGSYSIETDDWSYKEEKGYITEYQKGNTYCYTYYGISFWTKEDAIKLKNDFAKAYESENGKDYFWEFIPLVLYKEQYKVRIRKCRKEDIIEIDNYYELLDIDDSYKEPCNESI